MYDSFDSFRLRTASVLSGAARPADAGVRTDRNGDGFPSPDMDALADLSRALCTGDLRAFEDSPSWERTGISYTFTGSFWKELFRSKDHEGIEKACLVTAETIEAVFDGDSEDILPVTERFHDFYSELMRKKEDILSRYYTEAELSVMELGLSAWDVLESGDIERYGAGERDEDAFRNEIVERKLSRELRELKGALKEFPASFMGDAGDDGLIAVLLYDSLRTARCSEADKAEAFLRLAGMCGLGEIKSEEDWYLFRDNRTQFAADSFLMIHDVTDEDRFWKRVVSLERKTDLSLPLSTGILRAAHGLMSAFEAYTLCGDHYLPSGFSADEYSDRLAERLTGYILGDRHAQSIT